MGHLLFRLTKLFKGSQHRISVRFCWVWLVLLVLGCSPAILQAQSTSVLPSYLPMRLETEGVVAEFKALRSGGLPPLYYETSNLGAAQTSRTNRLWPGGGLGLNLSGQRMTLCCISGPNGSQPYFYDPKAGIWDGGGVRATHQELVGRVTQRDAVTTSDNHATHVAGTMIASGEQPTAKGMAYAAKLDAYDWNSDEGEMAGAAAQGLLMSNHSYGLITGWAYGDFDGLGSSRWFWWGDESDTICADFGLYSQQARDWDLIANIQLFPSVSVQSKTPIKLFALIFTVLNLIGDPNENVVVLIVADIALRVFFNKKD